MNNALQWTVTVDSATGPEVFDAVGYPDLNAPDQTWVAFTHTVGEKPQQQRHITAVFQRSKILAITSNNYIAEN